MSDEEDFILSHDTNGCNFYPSDGDGDEDFGRVNESKKRTHIRTNRPLHFLGSR